jgi:ankyrin repeat protein
MAAIHWAARSGHTAAVELLVQRGADVQAVDGSVAGAGLMSARCMLMFEQE